MTKVTLDGVREYNEEMNVEVDISEDGRPVIRAFNEAGCNSTEIDLEDLIAWINSPAYSEAMERIRQVDAKPPGM